MIRRLASADERLESDAAASVEIRVHGIGDHDEWSELGSPGLLHVGMDFEPDVALPPTPTPHALRLINWSRTSRRRAGWLWYVAMPFTLINTAGHMSSMRSPGQGQPRDGRLTARQVRAYTAGAALTLLAYVWAVAIVETITRPIFVEQTSTRGAAVAIALTVGVALAGGMALRIRAGGLSRASGALLVNVAVVVLATAATASLGLVGRNGSLHSPLRKLFFTVSRCGIFTDDHDIVHFFPTAWNFNPLVTVSLAAVLLVVLLSIWAAASGVGKPDAAAHAGEAIALSAAAILFVSVASSARLFIDNSLAYLRRRDLLPGQFLPGRGPDGRNRSILPTLQDRCAAASDNLLDVLPLLGFGAALALLIGMVVINTRGVESLPAAATTGFVRAVRVHRAIVGLRKRLMEAYAYAAAIWIVLGVISLWLWLDDPRLRTNLAACVAMFSIAGAAVAFSLVRGTRWLTAAAVTVAGLLLLAVGNNGVTFDWRVLAAVAAQALSVLTAILILQLRGRSSVRTVLAAFADVIGFWPVTFHPLAGASYRDDVVSFIQQELAKPRSGIVVIVGHSQGSVLSAWAIDTLDSTKNRLALVTCGSPLQSLYQTFFPLTFDEAFFERVSSRVEGRWANFWRETDPIATNFDGMAAYVSSAPILDPPGPDHPLLKHGDYWIATDQQEWIRQQIPNMDEDGSRDH